MRGSKIPKAKAPAEKPLSHKERLFADHYLINGNGRQSAILAGYAEGSAEVQAHRLLAKSHVKAYLEKRKKKIYEKLEITQEKIFYEMGRIALFNPKRLYDDDGNLKPVKDLDDDVAAVLASLEIEEEFTGIGKARKVKSVTKKVKLWNKPQALEVFFHHFKLLKGEDDGLKLNIVIKKGGANANGKH